MVLLTGSVGQHLLMCIYVGLPTMQHMLHIVKAN